MVTRKDPTPFQAAIVAHLSCTHCGAAPGEWCRNAGGAQRRAQSLHADREHPAREIWAIGYQEAEADADWALQQYRPEVVDQAVDDALEQAAQAVEAARDQLRPAFSEDSANLLRGYTNAARIVRAQKQARP